jgi:NAD(P)-dependent dehydrogenase (short-subunit alcohol dehydrogenase family)
MFGRSDPPDPVDIEIKPVAVVTGAANGIGFAVARDLARTHRVAILDIDEPAARRAAKAIRGDTIAVRCDIAEQESVTAAVDAVVGAFGGIDVAVSNAGIGPVGALRHLDPSVLSRVLDVNVTGNWRFIKACLPHLELAEGYVLGVASAAAIFGPPGEGMYAASKAGIEALLNVLRVELAQKRVGVGIAYPMFIDTPMVRDADREHPDFARVRTLLPGAAGKTFPVDLAAQRIVAGIRRRRKRIFVPGGLRIQFVLRGALSAALDPKLRQIAAEVDRLTSDKVAARGAIDGAWTSAVRDPDPGESTGNSQHGLT